MIKARVEKSVIIILIKDHKLLKKVLMNMK